MKKIIIKNFKCFEEQEFNLENLTILAGANGSGKSTLIQAMLLFRQSMEIDRIPIRYSKRLYLNDYYFEGGISSDILYANAKEDKISFEFIVDEGKSELFECIVNKEEPRILEIKNFQRNGFEQGIDTVHNRLSIYGNFDFISADRYGPKLTYEVSNTRRVKVGKYGEFTPFVLNEFKNELIRDNSVYFDKESEKTHSLLTEVNSWLSYILDGMKIKTEVLESVNLSLLKLTNYPEAELDFKSPMNMPYGASYVLPIIVSCLSKKIRQSRMESIVVIENPEAHLHPSAQSKLGQFLAIIANSGVQVIIETHSDHVINGIRIAVKKDFISNEKVIFNAFSKGSKLGENIVEEIIIDENGKLNKWPEGFFDQYETDMMELL